MNEDTNEKEKFINESNSQLCFNGYPVRIRVIDNDCLIWCKNTIGLYSQMDDFLNKKKKFSNYYPWGVRKKDQSEITQSINNKHICIACLEGTYEETHAIMSECKNLIQKNGKEKRVNN